MVKQVSVISPKGQTTVPEDIRRVLGLTPGRRISWMLHKGMLAVEPVPDVMDLAGSVKSPGTFKGHEAERAAALAFRAARQRGSRA